MDQIEIFGYPYAPNLNTITFNGDSIKIDSLLSKYDNSTQVLVLETKNFVDLNVNGPMWVVTWNNYVNVNNSSGQGSNSKERIYANVFMLGVIASSVIVYVRSLYE